jgi:Zn ribbon nucleic-acid-binding protein
MTAPVFAAWTCAECGGKGSVSGDAIDTSGEPNDPVPFNCFYCQGTVNLVLPPGLHRRDLRVEGAWTLDPPAACPRCAGALSAYWDERGTPLATCPACGHAERLPEVPADPAAWEVLLESREEKIERRKVDGGWQFRSESYAPKGRRKAATAVATLEGFEPEPGRPLKEIFADIRAEHLRARERLAEEAAARRRRPKAPPQV